MNFWDLCVACGRAIGRACVAIGHVLARMVRLTWRYWYIVVTMVVLGIAAALFHTRPDNIVYRVNATALINGASMLQFEEAFQPLRSACLLPPDAAINPYIYRKNARSFDLFRVVDALGNGTADYVDFKRKSSPTDTVKVQMQDRVNIQFCVQGCNIHLIPEIEQAVLDLLNSNEGLQQAYTVYLQNLQEEVAFNHRQAVKLDSLTSTYYYNAGTIAMASDNNGTGVNFYGDRKIRLFLNDIYKQQLHTQLGDYKLQFATAPVVLENHFAVDSKPVKSRMFWVVVCFLLGWGGGCLLADIIDKRKELIAWLKK